MAFQIDSRLLLAAGLALIGTGVPSVAQTIGLPGMSTAPEAASTGGDALIVLPSVELENDADRVISFPMPGSTEDDTTRILPPDATGEADDVVVTEAATRLSALWPATAGHVTDGRLRLAGERATVTLLLMVDDARAVETLELTTLSSAYVLPDRSQLRITIGDTTLDPITPDNITGLGTVSIPVPRGALRPGVNRVVIEADHVHRVFCGADAAYDLWTEVELGQSGVRLPATTARASAESFLAAVAVARGAEETIRVRFDERDRGTALIALHDLGRVVNGEGLSFDFADAADDAPAGTGAEIVFVSGAHSRIDFRQTPDGAAIMQVVIGPSGLPDVHTALGRETAAAPLEVIETGVPVSLRDLGYADQEVSEHLWQGRFDFALPADWLITTDARAEIGMRLGTGYTLPTGARIRVLVNGTAVRMLPLDDRLYASGKALPVRFPSRLLQGGRNELRVELVVPGDPADRPCPIATSPKIFLDADTTILVPTSPGMQAPNLGQALDLLTVSDLTLGGSDETGGADVARVVSTLPLSEAVETERDLSLRVLTLDEVPQASFGDLWSGREILINTLRRPETGATPAAPDEALFARDTTDPSGAAPVEPMQMALLPTSESLGWVRGRAEQVLRDTADLLRPDPATDLADWMGERSARAMLYQLDKATPDQMYLVLSDADDMPVAAAALARAMSSGVPLSGQAALLGWDGEWSAWTDRSRLPVLTGQVSAGELRAVIGNYASARPLYFVLSMLVLTLLSAVIARGYLLSSRDRT